ncbi:MAG: hypothetical protein Q8M03_05350 [Legionella sp.]|jgi:hypothetical protein|nr:hypothetical protein [Legionella sp.]
MAALTEQEVKNLFYVRLTQALHATVAEAIERNDDCHLIHVLGQMKRFERAIERAAGDPQAKVSDYPE